MNIVITGASRGIGYETALYFAKSQENRVYALSRNEAGLKALVESAESSRIIPLICDIADETKVAAVVSTISREIEGLDILVNNAGLLINRPFEELTLSDWRTVYDVNVFGAMNLTRLLLPLLKRGNISASKDIRSHILNISSMGGMQGSVKFKGLSAYSTSKGALVTMTECLAEELSSFGIYVNCLALGSVETEMFLAAFPGNKASAGVKEISAWIGDFALKGYPFFNGKVIPVSSSTP